MFNIGQINGLPVSACQIQRATQNDPTLSKKFLYIMNGWPDKVANEELKPYFSVRNELSLEGNCILRGIRVAIERY